MTRTAPTDYEREAWGRGLDRVVGVDEAGCGPLAGPVVASAVALRRGQTLEGVYDSKALSARQREELARELLLVDGRPVPELGDHEAIVKGDRLSLSIACASILSKTVRDRLMERLSSRYPAYGWGENKGYATGQHLAAIREHGPTPHHRRTWAPIVQPELPLEV
jgi:ribonuclease HII